MVLCSCTKYKTSPSRLDPSARRVDGGLVDTRAEGESMSAEGSESAYASRYMFVCEKICSVFFEDG